MANLTYHLFVTLTILAITLVNNSIVTRVIHGVFIFIIHCLSMFIVYFGHVKIKYSTNPIVFLFPLTSPIPSSVPTQVTLSYHPTQEVSGCQNNTDVAQNVQMQTSNLDDPTLFCCPD